MFQFNLTFKTLFFTLFILISFTTDAQTESFEMTQIGSNNSLHKPWDLHYGPDNHLWITERQAGIIMRVNPVTAKQDELIQITDVYSTAGQDGLLGIALHDGLLSGNPFVFLSYTYFLGGNRKQKLVRYTYTISGDNGSLSSPLVLLDNLPSSNDHNSGRLIYSNEMLYYTIGDQGSNKGVHSCKANLAQVLPTQVEIDAQDWTHYPGKILRINTDGTIPKDNPILNGVKSHIYTYGHRNPQGIVLGSNGLIYSDEHGPDTDDEINLIIAGDNYGWPNVTGYRDNQFYEYCNLSISSSCGGYNNFCTQETSFLDTNYREPLLSMFAASNDYEFNNPLCSDSWICRPNIAPSSIEIYESDAIPSWKNSLLVTSLKKGRIYRLKLEDNGTAIIGDTLQHFYTQNRYRDITMDPNGKSFYIITDNSGSTSDASGYSRRTSMNNPGTILKFTLKENLAVNKKDSKLLLDIWPNPASNILNIKIENDDGNYKAELINSIGQVIKTSIRLKSGLNEIGINDFLSGIYILKIFSRERSWYERVVIN